MKTALVLSGGSIKGAFQAGAIAQVLESGFVPDAIYGTSVGSLNGGFLAERAGRAVRQGQELNWRDIGQELEQFWLTQLKSPSQVARKRGTGSLLAALVRERFDGLTDTSALREMVGRELQPDNLRASPVPFYACSVNLATGEAVYATPAYSGIGDYIIASTAIPIEMPVTLIGQSPYVDGGVREVAPLKKAIDDGAEEIICIVCQPKELQGVSLRTGNLMEFALRLMDIVTNELVNNDLERFGKVDAWLNEYEEVRGELVRLLAGTKLEGSAEAKVNELLLRLRGKWRPVELHTIRPENEIVLDLLSFTREEIEEIIKQGRNAARKEIGPKLPDAGELSSQTEESDSASGAKENRI